MQRRFPVFLLLLLVAFATGCVQTRHVSPDVDNAYSFEKVNTEVEGRRVDVKLTSEHTMASTALRVTPDSTWWLYHDTGDVYHASTLDIMYVSRKRPDRGALQGALIGGLGGALVGLAAGLALQPLQEEDSPVSPAHYVSVIIGGGALLGIGTGTLIGAQKGSWDRYVYPRISEDYATTEQQ